jgi:hypothetical protein
MATVDARRLTARAATSPAFDVVVLAPPAGSPRTQGEKLRL